MTTKKQRRASVKAKRERYDAESLRMGLVAQERSRNRKQDLQWRKVHDTGYSKLVVDSRG